FAGKKSAQIREILISESAWEEMTCLFAPSLALFYLKNKQKTKIVHIRRLKIKSARLHSKSARQRRQHNNIKIQIVTNETS
ncbi:hypothetical protein ACUNHN_22190, partial [Serratia sp. IR-2025]